RCALELQRRQLLRVPPPSLPDYPPQTREMASYTSWCTGTYVKTTYVQHYKWFTMKPPTIKYPSGLEVSLAAFLRKLTSRASNTLGDFLLLPEKRQRRKIDAALTPAGTRISPGTQGSQDWSVVTYYGG